MRIVIPGDPIPLARHRSYIRNGHIACYDIQATDKNDIRLKMLAAKTLQFEEKAYRVRFQFNFLPPNSASKATKNMMLWGIIPHTSKPDNSNVLKLYEDCGNNILWSDDRYLVDEHIIKRYSNNPCTIIDIEIMKEVTMSKEHEQVFKTFSPEDIPKFTANANRIIEALYPFHGNGQDFGEKELAATSDLLIKFANDWTDKLKKIRNK
jgi:Holliday junction resolvase RusA-like endonuclease